MCCGRLRFDRTLFFPGEVPGDQTTIEVPSYLIRHDRGVVLFDTGVDCFAHQDPIAHLDKRIASAFTLCAAPNENPTDQLRSVGLTADDATQVINSQFHFDPCGCNALFPRSTFIVKRAEMDMARAAKSPYNPAYWDHPFEYRVVDGEHDVFGDGSLLLIPTPGHTPGHQSLRVHAAPGVDFLLTADASYSRAHLDRKIIPNAGAAWFVSGSASAGASRSFVDVQSVLCRTAASSPHVLQHDQPETKQPAWQEKTRSTCLTPREVLVERFDHAANSRQAAAC